MKLWIVGRMYNDEPWEFMGIYDDRDVAISKCVELNDFIGPATLNEDVSQEKIEWPECVYPLDEK